jgi:rhomboid protease GluP
VNAPYTQPPPQRGAPIPTARPRWTYIFIALNVIVFVAMIVVGFVQGGTSLGIAVLSGGRGVAPILIDFGANFAPLVAQGEFWRLFTANFIHIGIVHLLFNMYALLQLGVQVESVYGRQRFIALYLLAGISGAVFSYMFTRGLSAGASTSIFGLFGALVVYFYKHRELFGRMGQQQLINLGVILLINVIIGLSPGASVDNWGHAGGFVGGAILGWFMCPRYVPVDPFARAFEPAVAQNRKPELSNGVVMDANTLSQQVFVVALFIAGLIALTLLTTASASAQLP